MSNDKIIIAPKGRLTFGDLVPPKPRSVIDDLLGPNPSADAKMVYLTNPPSDDAVEYRTHHTVDGLTETVPARYKFSGADERHFPDVEDNAIPLAMTRESTYRTEFKLRPYQVEALEQIKEIGTQTYERYQNAIDEMIAVQFLVPARHFGKTVTATTATETALRAEEMMRKVRGYVNDIRANKTPANIIYSKYATKPTSERLFPFSRHRSHRIEKKLIKRFGGVYRQEHTIWKMGYLIIAHPSFRAEIEAKLAKITEPD